MSEYLMPFDRFAEKWEDLQRRLKANPQEKRAALRKGIGTAKGTRPWTESVKAGLGRGAAIPVNPDAPVDFDVPAIRKRTATERIEDLMSKLMPDILEVYKKTGRFELPPSLCDDLIAEYWRQGITVTREELERMTLEQVNEAIRFYAAKTLEKCSLKYENSDLTPNIRTA